MALQNFLADYNSLWMFVIVFAIVYFGLLKLGLQGSKIVLAIISLLISFVVISSVSTTNYLVGILPFIILLMVLGFLIVLVLMFVTKDAAAIEKLKGPLGVALFIIAIIICITLAFNYFSHLNNILPNSSNSGLSSGLVQFKDLIYSDNFIEFFLFIVVSGTVFFFLVKK